MSGTGVSVAKDADRYYRMFDSSERGNEYFFCVTQKGLTGNASPGRFDLARVQLTPKQREWVEGVARDFEENHRWYKPGD